MFRRPTRSTRTDTLCPYTTLFRSCGVVVGRIVVPGLLDDAGGIDRHLALVGVQVLDAARGGGHGGSPFVRLLSLSANPRNRVAKMRIGRLMAHDYCVNHGNGALEWPPADSTAPTSRLLPNSTTAAPTPQHHSANAPTLRPTPSHSGAP